MCVGAGTAGAASDAAYEVVVKREVMLLRRLVNAAGMPGRLRVRDERRGGGWRDSEW